ncbi:MAG TPA: NAD(P)-dependent oxidoreductase [Ignavibacteria bacterium]
MKALNKINVFVADKIHDDGLKLLSKNFKVVTKYGLNNSELLNFISGYKSSSKDTLIIHSTRKIDGKFIDNLVSTSVKVLCTVSSGFDNIDVNACKKNRIKFFNVPCGNYISAAEHTFALMLAIAKRLKEEHVGILKGEFETVSGKTAEIYKKTIGIIGVGHVGSYVAKLARCFGMNIIGNDIKKSVINKYRWIKFVPLTKLLKISNIVSIHTPLDDSTRYLINKKNLKLLNRSSIILNCARGGVIDEKALYNSLKNNKIYYAGIDVFENEPNINFKFAKLSNVLLTPHLAGKTKESYQRMAIMAAEQIINYYK